ncbi:MAG: T9SS type A sorting domain-containing protein [Bacteroidia bacterium]|nr:T9SS type A sorting domain-containing protein [Bacteroidia bacterium]
MKRKNMNLRVFTLVLLSFVLGVSTYAQDKKEVKKVKIIKVDDQGNTVVEERILDGDDATTVLKDLNIDLKGEGVDMNQIKMEIQQAEKGDDGVLAKEKYVEMENGRKVVRTVEYKKDAKGNYVKHETEEVDGKITKDVTVDVTKEEMEKMESDHHVVRLEGKGEGHEPKMIIIRKDLGEGEAGENMMWMNEDGEEIDLNKMQKNIQVDVDVDETFGGEGERKIVIRQRMVFIRIDDPNESEIANLNKASEGGTSFQNNKSLELTKLDFYPNPSNGRFTLDFQLPDGKSSALVRVLTTNGVEIYREEFNSQSGKYKKEIDLSGYAGGIYFLSVTQGDKQVVKKIVLQD